ncbi:MAG: hypothetical protein AB8V19_01415 [Candidatus Midichloria sp.]
MYYNIEGSYIIGVAGADFSGDGKLDVVATRPSIFVLLNMFLPAPTITTIKQTHGGKGNKHL